MSESPGRCHPKGDSLSPWGPKRFDLLVLFKMVMLQQWYALSDPEIEEQVSDRLSFRRFLGLSVTDKVPDETTVCKFRNHLQETGLYDWLFETLQTELSKRRLIVKRVALVDATFVAAPRKILRQMGRKTKPGPNIL